MLRRRFVLFRRLAVGPWGPERVRARVACIPKAADQGSAPRAARLCPINGASCRRTSEHWLRPKADGANDATPPEIILPS
ncbi:hypothetical protein ERJ75_001770100 [Trypanosoma vivax]|nr:hypothetical protein ERJ75_001770100 [Trypanosoma vivax]